METDQFWDFFWDERLEDMETLGKREAILAASQIIRRVAQQQTRRVSVLEPGCGEGQIIGTLANAHSTLLDLKGCTGIDYLPSSIAVCRRNYPRLTFVVGNFTDPKLLEKLGQFDIVLLVNALHEVFSAAYSDELGEVDIPLGKKRVEQAMIEIGQHLRPGGYLVLFDGLEPAGDPDATLQIRFLDPSARTLFETFAREYHPLNIQFQPVPGQPASIELSRRHFTRYIDKSIFLGKRLWQTERLESYQYFTESEFQQSLSRAGFVIQETRKLTVNEEKWRAIIEIETPGFDFPTEHVLIIAQKENS